MNPDRAKITAATEWPQFTVKCALGSHIHGIDAVFDPDEVILFDPTQKGGSAWISAKSGSYVPTDETC
ncbi:hypothetical protein SAMN04487950_0515 [Halogranum rubrum]|uniref:Uncharacterized protein n=1 Tax=Halogranum rubrum TaxID=553466 RepID=A0A1I4BGB9_9EURY|nr:hypothetical protein SAMN04487950_0515 [Halogranum rubrum]